jgi:hypothetical protein
MSALVFISHSSRDRTVAESLCQSLEQRGISCWISSRDIGPGENFQEAIVRALRTVRVMLLVFTANANQSSEIKKELALASQNKLAVVPVRVEDVAPSDAFAYEFATRQWIDLVGDWQANVGKLVTHIAALVGDDHPATVPAAMLATAPKGRMGPSFYIGLGALGVLAIVGAGAGWVGTHAPAASTPAAQKPAPVSLAGTWVSEKFTSAYDNHETFLLQFDFEQSGDSLTGTVAELSDGGPGDPTGIHGGQLSGSSITFYTQGLAAGDGDGQKPYKESYRGTVRNDQIDFVRQDDLSTGGLPEKFAAKRQ